MRKLQHHEIPRPDPAALVSLPKHPISVVVDNVRSLHNVGSFFRTADAAALEHLHLCGISGAPDHPALHKTALGSQTVVPWSYHERAADAVAALRARGYTIAVLEITDRPSSAAEVQTRHFPLCLVVGNEVEGVADEIVAGADLALEIPQYGMKQSLNASVAFGIAAYDLVRRWRALHAG